MISNIGLRRGTGGDTGLIKAQNHRQVLSNHSGKCNGEQGSVGSEWSAAFSSHSCLTCSCNSWMTWACRVGCRPESCSWGAGSLLPSPGPLLLPMWSMQTVMNGKWVVRTRVGSQEAGRFRLPRGQSQAAGEEQVAQGKQS